VRGLATAGLIGGVVALRASLSGAEGGCQAETGAAAAMAAGAGVEVLGGLPRMAGHAVALAMQGTLGLVCDPLGGLVEIPCVFRNATGAAIALAAIEMALAGIEFPIPADEVIDTMGEIGRSMDVRYRETAGGGLAATPTGRRLAKERLVQIKRSGKSA
jgi:L-serine dehydratase